MEFFSSVKHTIEAATNLPIVYINNAPDSSALKSNKYIYVGSNEYDAGSMQVDYVLQKLNNPKELNVIILEGEKGHSGATQRTAAVKGALKAAGVKYNLVFCDYGNHSKQWMPRT